jgi:hypothetical protein
MCLLEAASRSSRRRAADAAACSAKFVKTARSGWIDATKRLKKLERRVGGDGRKAGQRRAGGPPPLTPAPYNARYSGLERRDLRRADTTPSRRQKTTTTAM